MLKIYLQFSLVLIYYTNAQETDVNIVNATVSPNGTDLNLRNGSVLNPQTGTDLNLQNGTILNLQNGTLLNPLNGTVLNSQNGTILNPQTGTVLNLQNGTILNPQNRTVLDLQNGTVLNPQNGTILNPQTGTDLNLQTGTDLNLQNGTLLNPQNRTVLDLQNGTILNSQNGSFLSSPNITTLDTIRNVTEIIFETSELPSINTTSSNATRNNTSISIDVVDGPNTRDTNNTLTTDTTDSPREPSIIEFSANVDPNEFLEKIGDELPPSCDGRTKQEIQPILTESSRIRKCCSLDENMHFTKLGGACETKKHDFHINIVDVTLFDECIEDSEQVVSLDVEAGNPCNSSYMYGTKSGDLLYIIQNGSLLLIDENRNSTYDIENEYCVDMDVNTGDLVAIVCKTSFEPHMKMAQAMIYTILMIISIPCLIIVSIIHWLIKELRTLHGICLSSFCICLALGFFLHLALFLSKNLESRWGYLVQYFMLSNLMWLFIINIDLFLKVWVCLRNRKVRNFLKDKSQAFMTYIAVCMTIPLIIVVITGCRGIPGLSLYFLQGWSDTIRSSQRIFIPSGCMILAFSICFFFLTLFKILMLKKQPETNGNEFLTSHTDREEFLKEPKDSIICTGLLLGVVTFAWIMEIVKFYFPTASELNLMEVPNALEGVLILLILVSTKSYRQILKQYWKNRGSYNCPDNEAEVEMQILQKKSSPTN